MMKKMYIFSKALAWLALMITIVNVNQTCMYWLGQDKIPEAANKLRRS